MAPGGQGAILNEDAEPQLPVESCPEGLDCCDLRDPADVRAAPGIVMCQILVRLKRRRSWTPSAACSMSAATALVATRRWRGCLDLDDRGTARLDMERWGNRRIILSS